MSESALRACRARVAALRRLPAHEATLGEIRLRPHQVEAVAQVCRQLSGYGGCLLADDVGRGKTFVALAVARRWARPLFVVPAALRDTWHRAMRRAAYAYPLVTHEALGRGRVPELLPDGVVVDESHGFRNPCTRRHAALAELSADAELLLLSATPVQNRVADLAAQLSLFLGSAAHGLSPGELARYAVRIEAADADAELPELMPPHWLAVATDDGAVLDAILALPLPPRALDAGDAGILRTMSLVRAWASSRAALVDAVARRRCVVTAIEQCIACGRVPAREDLRSWSGSAEDGIQLGLAPLLAPRELAGPALAALAGQVCAENAALARLSRLLAASPDPDDARAAALTAVAARSPGVRVLAFTERVSTARAYWRRLASHPGAAVLTARGGRITSGPISRRALLERFAPAAHGVREPPRRERVALLVSTDVLSEGMNLQDAEIVVHLDLPWNPARLAQRVGRVRRPGGGASVASYLMPPPAASEVVLSVERRLGRKLREASEAIGAGIDVLPGLLTLATGSDSRMHGHVATMALVNVRIASWRGTLGARAPAAPPFPRVAACVAAAPGWLACFDDACLLAAVGGAVGDSAALLDRAPEYAGGLPRPCADGEAEVVLAAVRAHRARVLALASCGHESVASEVARAVERRIVTLLRTAPRHARPLLARAVATVRHSLRGPVPLGRERALARALAADHRSLECLLRAVSAIMPRDSRYAARDGDAALPAVVIMFAPRGGRAGTDDGGP